MGTNYFPVRTNLFLYSYELDIMLGLLKSRFYKWTIHYIDDVFTLNNSKFDDYVDIIYPIGRFGALKSDSTHHFFRNACTKSGSLRFSQFAGC